MGAPRPARKSRKAYAAKDLYLRLLLILTVATAASAQSQSQPVTPPDRLRDRGPGLPTSMFGTYVDRGQLLVYPFLEYYWDQNFEYKPSELGAVGEGDFRGKYRASEGLVFVAYGLREGLAVEFEVAGISATLDKSSADLSALPLRTKESGLGDIEGQIRWRWRRETEKRPEIFSYAEVVVPHHADKLLIGTPGWELKYGVGFVRGHTWGTLTARVAIQYEEASSSHFDLGEYAIEYLRRVSSSVRLYAGIEGTQDELEFITELQWHVSPNVFVKLNNGVGLTSKATDWAPEIGVVFSLR